MSPSIEQIRTLPLSYDVSDSENSARKLMVALNPEWETSEGPIEFEKFNDGITNILFKGMKKRPGMTDEQIDDEAVLLRAYGNDTDMLIDRDREAHSHILLSKFDLAPPLFARFENGLLYKFIAGYACTPADLRRPDVWPATARVLGKWHGAMPTTETTTGSADNHDPQYDTMKKLIPHKPLPHLWSMLQKWILGLPQNTKEEKDRFKMLQQALEDTAAMFGDTEGLDHGAYIMSHCDLLSGNVIVQPGENKEPDGSTTANVSIIDYEYTTPAPAAFDLANHFAEWGGFECDYSVLPTRSQRRAFLKEYVREYRRHSKPQSNGAQTNGHAKPPTEEEDVERLMKEIDDFRGMPGLYWGVWGLIQAMISEIDFDYDSYADARLGEYAAWKAEVDGSRKKKGEEMPLRERRWAEE